MQFKTAAILALLGFYAGTVTAKPVIAQRGVLAERTCGDPKDAVPFYRAFNSRVNDHFYTTNLAERQSAVNVLGYSEEGIAGRLFREPQLDTTALYRLYNPRTGDHFYTTSAAERDSASNNLGYVKEGIAGHLYLNDACQGRPLYRLVGSGGSSDHFYTMSSAERGNAVIHLGYKAEGIAGYLYSP